jgi:hypothetical protein
VTLPAAVAQLPDAADDLMLGMLANRTAVQEHRIRVAGAVGAAKSRLT